MKTQHGDGLSLVLMNREFCRLLGKVPDNIFRCCQCQRVVDWCPLDGINSGVSFCCFLFYLWFCFYIILRLIYGKVALVLLKLWSDDGRRCALTQPAFVCCQYKNTTPTHARTHSLTHSHTHTHSRTHARALTHASHN